MGDVLGDNDELEVALGRDEEVAGDATDVEQCHVAKSALSRRGCTSCPAVACSEVEHQSAPLWQDLRARAEVHARMWFFDSVLSTYCGRGLRSSPATKPFPSGCKHSGGAPPHWVE